MAHNCSKVTFNWMFVIWIKVFNITINNWTNQLIMGRVGYVPFAMCRVGYVPSLLCAELSHNRQVNIGYAWEKSSISTRAFVLIPPLFEIFMCVSRVKLMK